jgi:hydrogenase maturation protein HypF
MTTYHIHINGQVQGVGFRPFVSQLAEKFGVAGWVSNNNDGVHIEVNATPSVAAEFYFTIINNPPVNSIITHHSIHESFLKTIFSEFTINVSNSTSTKPSLLITPDIAICDECCKEVLEDNNRWFKYPFTTCLHCGPRYSIMTELPYDRVNTTMAEQPLCDQCTSEYNNIQNRRHFSQTLSCTDCPISMHLYSGTGDEISIDHSFIASEVITLLQKGKIIALKGIGGYLLLCDAGNELAISTLRTRKHRPQKPFALLYPNIEKVIKDVILSTGEEKALNGKAAPIVLCDLKESAKDNIRTELIAPGLDKIGVMLPYTPLLLLITTAFGKPVIATSGNISGSPIIYKDHLALEYFNGIADYIITYDREIVTPQDDSVIQFTSTGHRIILRRSRGLAPTYYPNPFRRGTETIFAAGGELKSAFSILNRDNLYISQFLGNQENIESQNAYTTTVNHLSNLIGAQAAAVLVDKHPAYIVSQFGKDIARQNHIPVYSFQHHKAHFGAVLAENHLLNTVDPILGIIWDGTGYGDDHQTWGSEFFIYQDHEITRVAHLDYYPNVLGDKMSKEPRLSALSLLRNEPDEQSLLKPFFSLVEWQYYRKWLHNEIPSLTSSMGRFLDGLSSILNICHFNTYEGEAAMKMEALASKHRQDSFESYPLTYHKGKILYNELLTNVIKDLENNVASSWISWKIFCSLAKVIEKISEYHSIDKLAFSGGVFQNQILTEIVIRLLSHKRTLYFHQQLSPNDECISFGQIACYEMQKRKMETHHQLQVKTIINDL